MQKICTRCCATLPLSSFNRRAASADGFAAACAACTSLSKRVDYWADSARRGAAVARAVSNKQARFAADPAYKRAFNLWGSTKKRGTKIPPWVAITDFVPLCRKALKLGPEYVLDHVIPLKHPLVCGLHVPANLRVVRRATNDKKGNRFEVL